MRTLFGLFLASLMASTTLAGNILAPASPELELTTTQPQDNGLRSALPQKEGPVEVAVSFELRDIDHIDDEAETIEFTGVLKQEWHDPRQAFDPLAEVPGKKSTKEISSLMRFFLDGFPSSFW